MTPPLRMISAPLLSRESQVRNCETIVVSVGRALPPPRAASIMVSVCTASCSAEGVHGNSKHVSETGKTRQPVDSTLSDTNGARMAKPIAALTAKRRLSPRIMYRAAIPAISPIGRADNFIVMANAATGIAKKTLRCPPGRLRSQAIVTARSIVGTSGLREEIIPHRAARRKMSGNPIPAMKSHNLRDPSAIRFNANAACTAASMQMKVFAMEEPQPNSPPTVLGAPSTSQDETWPKFICRVTSPLIAPNSSKMRPKGK